MSLTYRIKTAFSALLGITLLATVPGHAAGTLPIAMAQQVDINGKPVVCQVNFFVAGTVASPQNSYSDFGLSQNPNNQLSCDQTGRVPMFWLADGLVHVRMIDAFGVPIIDTTMQVLGPSSGGGGGGGTVDPTTVLGTGDLKARYGTGLIAGFVRSNGLTIGNAGSGATERANADTQNLFIYLYNTDPNLVVSGGRTGNALNDYNANKTITTPDWRGRALAFLDDMGNVPAGKLTSSYFGTSAIVLGADGGGESLALNLGQLPTGIASSNASQSITVSASGSNQLAQTPNSISSLSAATGGGGVAPLSLSTWNGVVSLSGTNAIAVTSNNTSGNAHRTVQPTRLATIYVKL